MQQLSNFNEIYFSQFIFSHQAFEVKLEDYDDLQSAEILSVWEKNSLCAFKMRLENGTTRVVGIDEIHYPSPLPTELEGFVKWANVVFERFRHLLLGEQC